MPSFNRFPREVAKTANTGDRIASVPARRRGGKRGTRQKATTVIRSENLIATPDNDAGSTWAVTESTNARWYEICRKVSYAIITQEDLYEVPPGWDGTETSPTWGNGLPDPVEPWFQTQRPHEIWYMDANFNRHIETFYVATGTADPAFTPSDEIDLVVIEAQVNENVDASSRIYAGLLSSTQAQAAIAQAQAEVA